MRLQSRTNGGGFCPPPFPILFTTKDRPMIELDSNMKNVTVLKPEIPENNDNLLIQFGTTAKASGFMDIVTDYIGDVGTGDRIVILTYNHNPGADKAAEVKIRFDGLNIHIYRVISAFLQCHFLPHLELELNVSDAINVCPISHK